MRFMSNTNKELVKKVCGIKMRPGTLTVNPSGGGSNSPFVEGELFRKRGQLWICVYVRVCPQQYEIEQLKEGTIPPLRAPEKRLVGRGLLERVFR